jgi:hypothetical protein
MIKKLAQKMLFCFNNISAGILLHVLGYSFRSKHRILAHLCQMMLPLRAAMIIISKVALLWHENVDDLHPY